MSGQETGDRAESKRIVSDLYAAGVARTQIERLAPDVDTPGGPDSESVDLRDALRTALDRLRFDLNAAGGPSTEVGESMMRLRAHIVEFYGRAVGERPPYLTVETATSPLPEGSEEVADERLMLEDESTGYRP